MMVDFEIDETGDIQFKNGDILITGDATLQNQKLIILAQKGDFKEYPLVGVGARDYILDNVSADQFQGEIQKQIEDDGMKIAKLTISKNYEIDLEATYKEDLRK